MQLNATMPRVYQESRFSTADSVLTGARFSLTHSARFIILSKVTFSLRPGTLSFDHVYFDHVRSVVGGNQELFSDP